MHTPKSLKRNVQNSRKTHLNVFKVAEDHNLGIYPIKNYFFLILQIELVFKVAYLE